MASNASPAGQPQQLTRQQLKDLERKELTPIQRFFELIIMILPLFCGLIAIAEYTMIPDKSRNANPGVYLTCLIILVFAYNVVGWYTAWRRVWVPGCWLWTSIPAVSLLTSRSNSPSSETVLPGNSWHTAMIS